MDENSNEMTRTREARLAEARQEWFGGIEAMIEKDFETAKKRLSAAVHKDPEQFDIWLALHALNPHDDQALKAMTRTAHTANTLRSQNVKASYWSTYMITEYISLVFQCGVGARYALTAKLIEQDRIDDASRELAKLPRKASKSPQARILRARIAMKREHYFAAIEELQKIDDRVLHTEQGRLLGHCFRLQGMPNAALRVLTKTAFLDAPKAAQLDSIYQLALASDESGHEKHRDHYLQIIYAENASYLDVRDRLFPEKSKQWEWENIVSRINEVDN